MLPIGSGFGDSRGSGRVEGDEFWVEWRGRGLPPGSGDMGVGHGHSVTVRV